MASFCVLIPSRSRAHTLAKTFQRMPFLLRRTTYVGIQKDEWRAYRQAIPDLDKVTVVAFHNPEGSVAIAREQLRQKATADRYDWYVATDDNARFTEEGVRALIQSADAYQEQTRKLTFMAGMHSTASHFDRHAIARGIKAVGGYRSYAAPGFIFHTIPHAWYAKYAYPPGCFALEDRHMMFAAIRAGHREFRVCMEAPFSKKRYDGARDKNPGGQGNIAKRRWNCGRAIEQLAHDFPEYMGVKGTWPTPWKAIFQYADGAQLDRLVGGAMRKGEKLERSNSLTIKRRKT